jgi:hypothetical protein
LLAVTFGVTWYVLNWSRDPAHSIQSMVVEDLLQFTRISGAVVLYAVAYALTALYIHRTFFSHRSPRLAGVLAVIIPGGLAVIPNIVLFFLNRLTWASVESLQLGNVLNLFAVREGVQQVRHLQFAGLWLLIAIALNARWFVRQVRNFRPLPPATAPRPEGRTAQNVRSSP